MSAGAGVCKDALVNAVPADLGSETAGGAAPLPLAYDDDAVCGLIRQVFFSPASDCRRRVLFAAAGVETEVHALSERIGKALSEMSGATIAVMHAEPPSGAAPVGKKPARPARDSEFSTASGVQIGERLWRVPVSLLSDLQRWEQPAEGVGDKLPFHYVLFASCVNDGITPLFCRACDGAVLVLTANRTRRESALRAREILEQYRTEVLGTVLDERKFPIPESIYRRL